MNHNTVLTGIIVNIDQKENCFELETSKGFVLVIITNKTQIETSIKNAKAIKVFGWCFDSKQIDSTIITNIDTK